MQLKYGVGRARENRDFFGNVLIEVIIYEALLGGYNVHILP